MEKKIPLWAEKKLGADFESAIAGAIRAVESQTQAEILPVLVRTSAAYGHVKWILFFIFFSFGRRTEKKSRLRCVVSPPAMAV